MAQMNMIQALNSAMDVMMARDPSVVVMGEDVGYFGGVFRVTDGLQRKYGEHRVLDSPIAEGGIVATAIGMAVNGLKPVAEIQFADYIYPAMDQIASELARIRYRTAGDFTAPVVVRAPSGGGIRGGQTHSQSPEAIFTHICGVKVVLPSSSLDRSRPMTVMLSASDVPTEVSKLMWGAYVSRSALWACSRRASTTVRSTARTRRLFCAS